ncbi:exocyst subunit exo70 family protein E1 [Striga hermonthica]|uniref:Exocyst subunit Exo70 family protein n=1 Tax=Striga hermonthica TaxID=68872 RepID=A0A9N7MZ55_STRHE|nr:exocyst subunit exo70 family protein E1 [Striga hermonthica]
MGDCAATTFVVEEREEEDLVAAAQEIVKALELKKKFSVDAKKILANLGSRLISISRAADESEDEDEPEEKNEGHVDVEQQLDEIQDKIMCWEKNQSMIWDCGTQEAHEYLESTDQIRKIIEKSENDSFSSNLLIRAHDLLQMAMSRLEDEFRHLLVHNRQTFEPEHVSFRSSEDENIDSCSIISSGDDSVFDDGLRRDSTTGRAHEEYTVELIRPEVISDLRSIANLMFDSNYGRECSQVFVTVQKDALDDCLFVLEFEKLSIEDVLKMEWGPLDSRIRRWVRALKLFVRVHLAAERLLADQVLGPAGPACFSESSRPVFLCLLDFAEAIAVGPHQPEKLIRILDMREALSGLGPDLVALFGDGPSSIWAECMEVLGRLDGCLRATFLEFETAVGSNISSGPFPGGGVHPLTKYVMNYMLTLTDYDETLNEVLRDPQGPDQNESTMGRHFRALTSILERNLEGKSGLYRDEAQQHLFLLNNVHYMAEKVKASELRKVLGDDWIRKRNWQFQQHAVNYERATWSSIIGLLKDEGLQNVPGSNSVSRGVLKERLQRFYVSFEEVYKSQTGWSVRDGQLREDLRIWTSLNVVQAYRTFVGRHMNHVSERYIKYTADDLEDYVLDLFEGSQKSLHGGHRR